MTSPVACPQETELIKPLLSPIYAITDPQLLPSQHLFIGVEAALAGGIRTIQLRDKFETFENKLKQAIKLMVICKRFDAQLIINDDIEIAKQSGAHGVHLGQGDDAMSKARQILGEKAIIGITCHSDINLAQQAVVHGADYIAFGRFFGSNTKPLASTAQLTILQDAKQKITLPIVAIGGIDSDNMNQVIKSGADTLAVCHSLFSATSIKQQAQAMMAQCRQN